MLANSSVGVEKCLCIYYANIDRAKNFTECVKIYLGKVTNLWVNSSNGLSATLKRP